MNTFFQQVLPKHLIYSRDKVRCSPAAEQSVREERFIGYEFEASGMYTTCHLGGSLDNLARFICSSNKNKLICNSSNHAIVNTIGTFIDRQCLMRAEFDELFVLVLKYQGQKNVEYEEMMR